MAQGLAKKSKVVVTRTCAGECNSGRRGEEDKEDRVSTKKRSVSVLFDDEEYADLVRKSAELTLEEGRRVSVAELVRRATLSQFHPGLRAAGEEKLSAPPR